MCFCGLVGLFTVIALVLGLSCCYSVFYCVVELLVWVDVVKFSYLICLLNLLLIV